MATLDTAHTPPISTPRAAVALTHGVVSKTPDLLLRVMILTVALSITFDGDRVPPHLPTVQHVTGRRRWTAHAPLANRLAGADTSPSGALDDASSRTALASNAAPSHAHTSREQLSRPVLLGDSFSCNSQPFH